ncbi:MAG: glycoside hydrolase family 15 protein [Candidatus Nanoarchaeia archaeon]
MQITLKRAINQGDIIKQHLKILKSLRYESGLFAASKKNITTGYNKAWLRDNFYECLAFELLGDWRSVIKTYSAIINIFKKHEYKIDCAIAKKPEHRYQYIHARYNPNTFDEFWDEWGNKQNDSIGCILFKIGEIESIKKIKILKTPEDKRIIQKLVDYLSTLEYWHDEDSGMWEENEEIHSSSIGACLAGLKMIKNVKGINVSDELIQKGYEALEKMLPRESKKKFADLALLSLIWPYGIVNKKQAEAILENVNYHLLKKRGVIRYKGDHYYNKNEDGYSEEAEWTFGLSWLSIIYSKINQKAKAEKFMKLAIKTINKKGEIPEIYFSNSKEYNDNSPLGWSESLFIVALYYINRKHMH